jgi:phosphomannomutase
MLNFSTVGRNCTLEERQQYFEWDNKVGERKKIAKEIRDGWPDLDAVIGGQISIDIYPKGNDKSQILDIIKQERLVEPDEYIFIGDRMEKGGNDYPLAQLLQNQDKPYGYTYETEGPEHTQRILENTHND